MIGFKTLPIKGLWRCLGLRLKDRNRDRGAAIVAAAPPTPPGMRVRTGRFERLRS